MAKLKTLALCGILITLTACQTAPKGNTDSLDGLKAMQPGTLNTSAASNRIRRMALKEMALSVGAQSALAWRAKQIDDQLSFQAKHLDAIFNFNALVLDHNVLPPVLLQGEQALNLADPQSIRLADRVYKIEKQAHFVTTPPNWRDYLWLNFNKPERPDNTMLPKNREEKLYWQHYVELGWEQGISQANSIFADNLARLQQDLEGMGLYRQLLAQGLVSKPYVASTELGVTGDGNNIRINDQVLRITALPQLDPNSKGWQTIISTKPLPPQPYGKLSS